MLLQVVASGLVKRKEHVERYVRSTLLGLFQFDDARVSTQTSLKDLSANGFIECAPLAGGEAHYGRCNMPAVLCCIVAGECESQTWL